MVKRAVSWLLAACVVLNPAITLAVDVAVDGATEKGNSVRIGSIRGVIVSVNTEGAYVKVAKEGIESARRQDLETLEFVQTYRDKEWDRSHVLLFIPRKVLERQPEPESEPGKATRGTKNADTPMGCYLRGKQYGRSIPTGGSLAGGFVGGLLLGIVGTVLAVVAQSEPDVPFGALPEDEPCKMPFIEGYQETGKSKKKSAALTGGLIGTVALIAVVVAVNSSSN